jgi:hypothetical protein
MLGEDSCLSNDSDLIESVAKALLNFLGVDFAIKKIALTPEQCRLLACFIVAGPKNKQLTEAEIIKSVSKLPNKGNLVFELENLKDKGYLQEIIKDSPDDESSTFVGFTEATTLLLTVVLSLSQEIVLLSMEKEDIVSDKVLKDFKPTTWN